MYICIYYIYYILYIYIYTCMYICIYYKYALLYYIYTHACVNIRINCTIYTCICIFGYLLICLLKTTFL